MPYSDAFRDVAPWFVQLWAESLGKKTGDGRHVGPTPIVAVGATDQHAQVQLFMEGPADKTVTFIEVEEPEGGELTIPGGGPAALAYLHLHRVRGQESVWAGVEGSGAEVLHVRVELLGHHADL